MILARDLRVYILSQSQYLLEWTGVGTSESQKLAVERSEAPEGGFQELIQVDDTVEAYTDTDPPSHQKYIPYYYRIKNPDDSYSDIAQLPYRRDKHMLQYVRQLERALKRDIGAESYLFHRLSSGKRCPECWDEELGQATRAKCSSCFGTTYEGGYSGGYQLWVHFPPESPDILVVAHTRFKISAGHAFASNYPLVTPEDVLVRNIDKEVYRVGTPVRRTARRLHVARQVFPVRAVERGSVEYELIDRIADARVEVG